jgi:hypothetical protein
MRYICCLVFAAIFLASCSGNKPDKTANDTAVSIQKLWEFTKLDTARLTNKSGAMWIGKNMLDMTKADTLRFNYASDKNNHTAYAYKIQHDTIFVNKNPAYKILKLTSDELDLYTIFKKIGNGGVSKDSIVMIYNAKAGG